MDQNEGEIDYISDGFDEFSGYDPRENSKSESLGYAIKCFLLKVVADGAEMALKDGKVRKKYIVGNQLSNKFPSLSRENWEDSSRSLEEETQEENCLLEQENNRVFLNSSDFNHIRPEYTKYDLSFMNIPNFLSLLTLKFITFQFNCAISFFTIPVWVSYFLIIFTLSPIYTLGKIKGYLVRKMVTTLDRSIRNVRVRVQRSIIKLGLALIWSGYVFLVLSAMLVLGFVIGGFLMKVMVEEPVMTKETLRFDYTQSSPVAIVPIASASSSRRAIPYDQKLQLAVSLNVPESEYNRKLGVFQVRVEFLDANGKVTAGSSYPCMLRFKSSPIRFVETAFRTAPLLAGFQSESQILQIKTTEFKEGIEPTMYLKITLEQRAEFKKGEGIPEVYSASVILESALVRFKRIIWLWRRTAFVWVSFGAFSTELVMVLLFFRSVIMPRGRGKKRVIVNGKKASIPILSWGK